nr:immunoglobulin heavy chain junction region [Mus musculus]
CARQINYDGWFAYW